MGPIWGRQDPGGPHVGPMNFAIWDAFTSVLLILLGELLCYERYLYIHVVHHFIDDISIKVEYIEIFHQVENYIDGMIYEIHIYVYI